MYHSTTLIAQATMAGGGAVNRGPHTGYGTEASAADLSGPQRKSILSEFDFAELARLQLPPASGIDNYAIFDKDDARAVQGSAQTFTKLFDEAPVRQLIDTFVQLSAPTISQSDIRAESKKVTIDGKEYTISGPRGGQSPQEVATLHHEGDDGEKDVLFVAPTATLIIVLQAAKGADTLHQTNDKQGVWTAIRSFAFALTEKGL